MTDDQKKYYKAMKRLSSKKPIKPVPKPNVSHFRTRKFSRFFSFHSPETLWMSVSFSSQLEKLLFVGCVVQIGISAVQHGDKSDVRRCDNRSDNAEQYSNVHRARRSVGSVEHCFGIPQLHLHVDFHRGIPDETHRSPMVLLQVSLECFRHAGHWPFDRWM